MVYINGEVNKNIGDNIMSKIRKFDDKFKPVDGRIVTNLIELRKPTEKVSSIEEGEKIATKLFNILNETKAGVGLTANQIGINKSVFVINVKEPLYFINPEIIEHSKTNVYYKESCLSIPQRKNVTTKRYNYVVIKADNLKEPMKFEGDNKEQNYKDIVEMFNDSGLFECIAVQHEFDHTRGKLIIDDDICIDKQPVHSEKKYNRNDKINIQLLDEGNFYNKTIKFKQYTKEMKKEGWKILT